MLFRDRHSTLIIVVVWCKIWLLLWRGAQLKRGAHRKKTSTLFGGRLFQAGRACACVTVLIVTWCFVVVPAAFKGKS